LVAANQEAAREETRSATRREGREGR